MTSPTLSRAGNEAELRLRRSAIVLRDMCASRGQWTTHDDHPEGVDADEVFPGVIVGNLGAAKNALYLKNTGVTHVLNSAEGTRIGTVNTSQEFYEPFGIKYKGLKLLDMPQANISVYFYEVADFIDGALKCGGKVLVNCLMGMSRSSTCVLAFLLLRRDMTAVEALEEIRKHRDVRPNDGFLRQIAELDNKLSQQRGQD